MAAEFSVTHLPKRGQYVLVQTERGLLPKIVAHTARNPRGSWSAPTTLDECPEASWDQRVFGYGVKVCPTLSTENELAIYYFANSLELKHVVEDARLDWPRFVSVGLSTSD